MSSRAPLAVAWAVRVCLGVFLVVAWVTAVAAHGAHAYDSPATVAGIEFEIVQVSSDGTSPNSALQATYAPLVVDLRLPAEQVAPGSAGSRFVVNGAGDVLDSARVTIPEGKFGYLLENPSKSGVFSDSMGFAPDSLDTALRTHLVDNFGSATSSVPMVGGGTKFSVTGPLTGPSGQKWTITTAWGVDPDGTIRLITATP